MKMFSRKPKTSTVMSLVIATGLVLSGCSSDDDTPSEETGGDEVTASLASIQEKVFDVQCILCHSGDEPAASLSLADGESYAALVDVQATNAPNVRVITGDSANSFLIRKMRGTDLTETEGARMPRNGPPFVEDAVVDVIAQWIDAGAQDN